VSAVSNHAVNQQSIARVFTAKMDWQPTRCSVISSLRTAPVGRHVRRLSSFVSAAMAPRHNQFVHHAQCLTDMGRVGDRGRREKAISAGEQCALKLAREGFTTMGRMTAGHNPISSILPIRRRSLFISSSITKKLHQISSTEESSLR